VTQHRGSGAQASQLKASAVRYRDVIGMLDNVW